eukprot:TRINITY_DN207_c0_g1_i1.p1 TRINITY_DN207_c0_g1~~TRINITY_DN207_c0_g1_i1.p1  ORF type:complete len:512 (+),score=145.93 TRINITY_DN207_c0_g1_i1:81-1616(+)
MVVTLQLAVFLGSLIQVLWAERGLDLWLHSASSAAEQPRLERADLVKEDVLLELLDKLQPHERSNSGKQDELRVLESSPGVAGGQDDASVAVDVAGASPEAYLVDRLQQALLEERGGGDEEQQDAPTQQAAATVTKPISPLKMADISPAVVLAQTNVKASEGKAPEAQRDAQGILAVLDALVERQREDDTAAGAEMAARNSPAEAAEVEQRKPLMQRILMPGPGAPAAAAAAAAAGSLLQGTGSEMPAQEERWQGEQQHQESSARIKALQEQVDSLLAENQRLHKQEGSRERLQASQAVSSSALQRSKAGPAAADVASHMQDDEEASNRVEKRSSALDDTVEALAARVRAASDSSREVVQNRRNDFKSTLASARQLQQLARQVDANVRQKIPMAALQTMDESDQYGSVLLQVQDTVKKLNQGSDTLRKSVSRRHQALGGELESSFKAALEAQKKAEKEGQSAQALLSRKVATLLKEIRMPSSPATKRVLRKRGAASLSGGQGDADWRRRGG